MKQISPETTRNVHLIGVGGCGMSGLAKILHMLGYTVQGSDSKESGNTIRLKDMGVKVFIGHDKSLIRQADLIVVSSAISCANPEYEEALSKGIPIWQRAEMLAWIMDRFSKRITVAGTHGKTTTTAMLAKLFTGLGFDPTFLIGGESDMVDGNARLGKGPFVIAEADESDSSFLNLSPDISIITNIECDHMEHFGDEAKLIETFDQFMHRTRDNGKIIINIDNENNRKMIERLEDVFSFVKYGLSDPEEFYATEVVFQGRGSTFRVNYKDKELGAVELSIPGWQNVQNSLAAIAAAMECGVQFGSIVPILRSFQGAKRRFDLVGEIADISIYDDYGHHPTEIAMTLQAAKLGWPDRRIICVFQPHRFTRTVLLKDEFAKCFANADMVILTDIYAASETPIPGVNGKMLADMVKENKNEVVYMEKKEKIPAYLMEQLRPGDILIVSGAGDIQTVSKEIFSRLRIANDSKI